MDHAENRKTKVDIEKTIYLIRHGESEDNTKLVFQSTDSPLSERGREQAHKVAERAMRLSFDSLVSSPYVRAKETAEIIAQATGATIECSDLFVERIKPLCLNGKSFDDEIAKEVSMQWYESLFTKGLKVQDGENYEEIVARAHDALDFLHNHTSQNILVVTHGFFLRVMIARVLLGDSMTEENLKQLQSRGAMKNTGITVLQYGKWSNEPDFKWRLWIYNDHNHLG